MMELRERVLQHRNSGRVYARRAFEYENINFGERSSNCLWRVCSIVCRTSADIQAFDLFIALRLDFAGLRGDASRYDVKQVCDCGCTEVEDSEHLLLRCRAFHEERMVMFRKVTKLCRAFRVHKWFAVIVERRHPCILADFLLGRNFTMPWMWNKRLTSFRGSLTSIVLDFLKTVCLCHGPLRRGVCASMNRLGPDAEDRAWDYPAIGPRK
jgi:hypothetical protein